LKEPHGPWNYYDPDVSNPYENSHIPPPPTFTPGHYEAQPEFIRSSLNGGSGLRWFKNPEALQEHARTFYRLITRADLALGRIMAAVKDVGLDENTVVIYSSDHGSMATSLVERRGVDVERRGAPEATAHLAPKHAQEAFASILAATLAENPVLRTLARPENRRREPGRYDWTPGAVCGYSTAS